MTLEVKGNLLVRILSSVDPQLCHPEHQLNRVEAGRVLRKRDGHEASIFAEVIDHWG